MIGFFRGRGHPVQSLVQAEQLRTCNGIAQNTAKICLQALSQAVFHDVLQNRCS